MTATHNSGPMITWGSGPAGSTGNNSDAGPGADFQGSSIVDPRYPYYPGRTGKGQVVATLNYAYACLADFVPSIKNAALVAAAQGPVVPAGGSVAMTLASTNQISPGTNGNRAVNVPVVPFGQQLSQANAVNCLAIDPAHTVGTTSTSSAVVTSVGDNRVITPGQWVCIPGGAGGTSALLARVVSKSFSASTITLDRIPGAALSGAPIMLMEWRNQNDNATGASVLPYYYAGAVAEMDPHGAVGRVLTVTSNNAGDTGYSVTITSYDAFGVLMRETISVSANATATGKKAHKYVVSATLNKSGGGTPAGTISIGTSDIFGLNIKNELWEYMNVFWAGSFASASTGWTAADTATATATTGDVRGTYAVQSSATDGVRRLAMFMSLPARQLLSSTYDDYISLYGVPQF